MRSAGLECCLPSFGATSTGGEVELFFVADPHFAMSMNQNSNRTALNSLALKQQESMLCTTSLTSSCCTGAFSGEMALAVVEKTVNDSKRLNVPIGFTTVRCHVMLLVSFRCACDSDVSCLRV